MIYLLIPTGTPGWDDMRIFTTFSSMEQVVMTEVASRQARGLSDRWCFIIAYDGVDELSPVWGYVMYEGYLQRCTITQSLSESLLQQQLERVRENRECEELL